MSDVGPLRRYRDVAFVPLLVQELTSKEPAALDSAGNVKEADLFRMRVVERMNSALGKIELYRRDPIALAGDVVCEPHPQRSRSSEVEPVSEELVKPEPMSPAARWREP